MFKGFFVKWYRNKGRVFPWRSEGVTPFEVLVTEMLLRQTRAGSVAKIWPTFVNRFRDPHVIQRTRTHTLVETLEPLGFGFQKAESLKLVSNALIEVHGGKLPRNRRDLLNLPHVGMYVTNATLCFAFNKPVEIVDTNVLRLLSRFYGKTFKPDIRRAPEAWLIAKSILPSSGVLARAHNYGLLDFTADVCRSGRPLCDTCPLSNGCHFAGSMRLSRDSDA